MQVTFDSTTLPEIVGSDGITLFKDSLAPALMPPERRQAPHASRALLHLEASNPSRSEPKECGVLGGSLEKEPIKWRPRHASSHDEFLKFPGL